MRYIKTFFFVAILFFGFSPLAVGYANSGSEGLPAVFKRVAPATVVIKGYARGGTANALRNLYPEGHPYRDLIPKESSADPQYQLASTGSGFIIHPDGYIVTNHHVIKDPVEKIEVTLYDTTELSAKIVGVDPDGDLAVLKVEYAQKLPSVKWGDSRKVEVGEPVFAIGSPFGLSVSLTAGIISAKNRELPNDLYTSYLQTDTSINLGNSGGPLFNMNGDVVGVNTAIYSTGGGSIGIGFAIPQAEASLIAREIIAHGRVRRGWLGATIETISQDALETLRIGQRGGVLIKAVEERGPAKEGGLQPFDVIVSINDRMVFSRDNFLRIFVRVFAGERITVVVVRSGEKKTLQFTLRERPRN